MRFATPTLSLCIALSSFSLNALPVIQNPQDINSLFPSSAEEIQKETKALVNTFDETLKKIQNSPSAQHNFQNTVYSIDEALAEIDSTIRRLELVHYSHPSEEIQKAAATARVTLLNHMASITLESQAIHGRLKEIRQKENLNSEEVYYLNTLIRDLELGACTLTAQDKQRFLTLTKEINDLNTQFHTNINRSNTTIWVNKKDLDGIPKDLVDSLAKDDKNNYGLTLDYPTYFPAIESCHVPETREKLYVAFQNRGSPENLDVLKKMIAKRHALAELLSYPSYAAMNLQTEMIDTPEEAAQFIQNLKELTAPGLEKELNALKENLPATVTLTKDGKIKACDLAYLYANYKKQHFDVDSASIAEYFPLNETVEGLIKIYEEFFAIQIEELCDVALWHPDVRLLKVQDNGKILGYICLDLFPRPGKYTHACSENLVPTRKNAPQIPVNIVLCNFTKPTAEKPALMSHGKEVITFFHELGHALHDVFGRSPFFMNSGFRTTLDFAELPSQLLEEWMWEPEIIQKVSRHYKSGDPLPLPLIEKMCAARAFGNAHHFTRQACLAHISLHLYYDRSITNPTTFSRQTHALFTPQLSYPTHFNHHAAFGHLEAYGARYYCYALTKTYGMDVFEQIQKEGLLSPSAGKRYASTILNKGGSQNPKELLNSYLGRPPQSEALIRRMKL